MRIAITADPMLPVPPEEYGGIERMIHLLALGLTERGHEVTLFAHSGSRVPCRLIRYPISTVRSMKETMRIAYTVATEIFGGGYHLVHSFGRLAYIAPILPLRVPKLMTYQRAVTSRTVALGSRLARGSLAFCAISRHMTAGKRLAGNWNLVYNGVAEEQYTVHEHVPDDAPLAFLGRIERIKGVHVAIDVARRSGRRLLIAGNVPDGIEHRRYFDREIAPHLERGDIQYVGPVNDAQKNTLLGTSAALLMPILWEEPFGIVMAEALACGTPIVGFARGSVPEIVQDGVNGFVCASVPEMADAVARIGSVSRALCRRTMEEKFSARTMVDGYEHVYRRIVDRSSRSGGS